MGPKDEEETQAEDGEQADARETGMEVTVIQATPERAAVTGNKRK